MCAYWSRYCRIAASTAGAIRSGRLCSAASRQRSVTCASGPARRSASSSRASGPQARTSTPWAAMCVAAASRRRTAFLDEALRGLDRGRRVAAIGSGADRAAELLVERSAADKHDVVVADALLLEPV